MYKSVKGLYLYGNSLSKIIQADFTGMICTVLQPIKTWHGIKPKNIFVHDNDLLNFSSAKLIS
jgi:hypothetical protein